MTLPAGAAGLIAWLAILHLEATSRLGFDAHTQLAVVDRVDRLGGSYYTTGTDQKGPLWLASYHLALAISNHRDVWFVIAGIITSLAAVTGAAVAGILRSWGATRAVAAGVGVALWLHLCFGREEYSWVLYSRNIVIALSAVALWLLAGISRTQRHGLLRLLLAGIGSGLAIQTNPSSMWTLGVLAAYVAAASRDWPVPLSRHLIGPIRRAPVVFLATASSVIVATFGWYAARGSLGDFWAQWWTYNSHYAEATGRSPLEIATKGVSDFTGYYTTHWLQGIALVGASLVLVRSLRGFDVKRRRLTLVVMAWWLAEVIAVVSPQRFFHHYLVLPLVPLAVLTGMGVARLIEAASSTRRHMTIAPSGIAVATVLTTIVVSAWPALGSATELATEFDGRQATYESRIARLKPGQTRLRTLVQGYTSPNEFVYFWSNEPSLYTLSERPAATRYIEARWLRGEIYYADTDPKYVLPGTWSNWIDDMKRSNPKMIVVDRTIPVPPSSPMRRLLACPALRLAHTDRFRLARKDRVLSYYVREGDLAPCWEQRG